MAAITVADVSARPLPVPFASDYLAENWGLDEGFPENSCTGLAFAPDGAMWLGTFRGLVRFNGQRFSTWTPAALPELKSTPILNMFQDRSGRVWFSTSDGLVLHERGTWRRWQENDGWGNRSDIARGYAEAPDGTLVIPRASGRVMRLAADGRWQELPTPPGTGGTMCAFDAAGVLHAFRPGFVGVFENGAWRALAGDAAVQKSAVGIGQGRENRVVVVCQNELLEARGGGIVKRTRLSRPVAIFWRLAEDAAGTLWLPAVGAGVYRIRPDGEVHQLLKPDGLPSSGPTRMVHTTDDGSVWIGSGVGGLARLRPRRFRHVGEAEGMGDRVILTLAPVRDGRVLLTSYGAGLAYFDGEKNVEPLTAGPLGAALVRSVLQRRDGSVWLGTAATGLLRLDGPDLTPVESGIFGPKETINTLFEDSRGRLWIGGEKQVAVEEAGAFRVVGPLGHAERTSSTMFAERADGTVLLARDNALYAYGPAGLQAEPVLRLPEFRQVSTLLVDREDRVWLGTARHGLSVWQTGELATLSSAHGLPGEAISSLVQDAAGRLWFGCNRVVVRAAPAELWRAARTPGAQLECEVFDQSDGLRDLDFPVATQPSVAQDARGRLWFALVRGAAMIDPAELKLHARPPPVIIESISYVPDSRGGTVELSLDAAAAPTLPAGSRLVRISYAALDFLAPRKQRFRVRLDGERNEWQDMRNESTVNLLEVPAGRHTLEVQASGSDGVWNRTGATLAFTVAPFYWQTAWFRSLAVLGLTTCVGGGVWLAAQRRLRTERDKLTRDRHLAEAQARLALVLENTSDFVEFADAAGRLLYINRAGRAMVGLGAEEDVGLLTAAAFLPASAQTDYVERALPAALRDGTWSGESTLRHRDGTEIPVSLVLLAHRSPGGALDFVSVIARDISVARRHARTQEALRLLAARLSAALEPQTLGPAIAETCRDLFGHDAFFFAPVDDRGGVELGAHIEDTPHGTTQPRVMPDPIRKLSPALRSVLAGEPLLVNRAGTDAEPSLAAFSPHGAPGRRSASLMYVPVRWEGKTLGVISVQSYTAHRYTPADLQQLQTLAEHCSAAIARLDAEASLRANEERLRLAMQSARMGSWEIAVATRQLVASPEAEAVYGCAAGQLSGPAARLTDRVPDDDAPALRAALEDLLAGRSTELALTHRLLAPDGSERWVEVKGRHLPPTNASGQARVIGVTADITGRRRAELARTRLEEQLRQAQKLEAVGTLAGGIAHDFNNILTAILGNAELALLETPPHGPLAGPLDQIRRSGHRARDLVRRILAFSRPRERHRQLLALLPLVEEVVKLLRSTIPTTTHLAIAAAPRLPPIEADPSEIHQVLLNLGTNAWQAIGNRPGHVTFALETVRVAPTAPPPHPELTPGDYLRLAVRDDGPGIPADLLPRIFDPFFTTKTTGGGTGLGLSIAHGIMRTHGGAITVASTVGQGTEFALYFPTSATPPEPTPAQAPEPPAPRAAGQGQRILCVDDEETILELSQRLLTNAGYAVTGTTRPTEALALVRARPDYFDVIITDLSMPEMSGVELAADVHRLRPDLPIVLATGYLRAGDAEAAQAAGIREILQKPQSLDQLVATVSRLVTRS